MPEHGKKPEIFTVKTVIGKELTVANLLELRIQKNHFDVKSIIVPDRVRGYIFIETYRHVIPDLLNGVPNIRGKPVGRVKLEELEHLLIPKPIIKEIKKGDIVEIVSGPLRGSRARVVEISHAREEITVDLLDNPVIIPITIHADSLRIISSKKDEEAEEEEQGPLF